MPRRFHRLLFLDPELGCSAGHYENYASAIGRACREKSLSLHCLGGPGSTAPVFDRMNASYVPRKIGGALVNPFFGAFRMTRQLRRWATPLADARTIAFAATANHRCYAPLAGWLASLPEHRAPALAVLLRFSDFDAARNRWRATAALTRLGLQRLERAARRRTVRLVADSEALASEFERLTNLPVTCFSIPHMLPDVPAGNAAPPAGRRLTRIGYFGEARREKGFAVLLDALDLLAASGGGEHIEVVIQTNARPEERDWTREARRRLEGARFASVRLIDSHLDESSYHAEFLSCDAIVLPYLWRHYRSRNSGVFADALAAGLPVIVTGGTWMSEQLPGRGAGIVVPSGDANALASAIAETASRRDELRKEAAALAPAWRARHSADNFVQQLVSLCG